MKKGYYVKKDSILEAVDANAEAPFILQRFKINWQIIFTVNYTLVNKFIVSLSLTGAKPLNSILIICINSHVM